MKLIIEKRIEELTDLKTNNDDGLLQNRQTLEQLTAEIRAGEMREIAIGNRLAELAALLEHPPAA